MRDNVIKVRFIAVSLRLPTIETQAIRIYRELNRLFADDIQAELSLLSRNYFSRDPGVRSSTEELVRDMDVVVVVKHGLFTDFLTAAPLLQEICRQHGAILVAHPCDGPGADGGEIADVFTSELADYVLALTETQAADLASVRPVQQIKLVGHASRVEGEVDPVPVRDKVATVLWENPVHYNPGQMGETMGGDIAEFKQLEELLRAVCETKGARLSILKAWYPPQKYPQWERTMREVDIAIECKALNHRHTRYQKQKPAVKVLNYLALGLPVICDSLPSYRELGAESTALLFADSLQEWEKTLLLLLDDHDLRKQLANEAVNVAQKYKIENICTRWRDVFSEITKK